MDLVLVPKSSVLGLGIHPSFIYPSVAADT